MPIGSQGEVFLDSGAAVAVVGVVDGEPCNGGTSAVRAPTRLTIPYPYTSSRPGGPLSMAVAVSRCTTSVADRFGYFARTSATAPATIAVASLVPVPSPYPWPREGRATSTAGADSTT
jgi:hypothetical protein